MRLWRRFKQGLPMFRLPGQVRRSIPAAAVIPVAVRPVRGRAVSTRGTPGTRSLRTVRSAVVTWPPNTPTFDVVVAAGGIRAVTDRVGGARR